MFGEITKENIAAALVEHTKRNNSLKEVKKDEMDLRKKIVSFLTGKVTQTTKVTADIGPYAVEATSNIKTDIEDKEELVEDWPGFSPELQECFPMKPSFSKTGFGKLGDDDKAEAEAYLIEKPAAPTLSVKEL